MVITLNILINKDFELQTMSDKSFIINYRRYYITMELFFGAKMHQSPKIISDIISPKIKYNDN